MSSNGIIDMQVVPLKINAAGATSSQNPIALNSSSGLYIGTGTKNYNKLENKPSINGVELIGDKSSADLFIDRTYIHNQNQASAEWHIHHGLNKRPSVSIVDTAGTVVVGEVQYIDEDNIVCRFSAAFSGAAYLN